MKTCTQYSDTTNQSCGYLKGAEYPTSGGGFFLCYYKQDPGVWLDYNGRSETCVIFTSKNIILNSFSRFHWEWKLSPFCAMFLYFFPPLKPKDSYARLEFVSLLFPNSVWQLLPGEGLRLLKILLCCRNLECSRLDSCLWGLCAWWYQFFKPRQLWEMSLCRFVTDRLSGEQWGLYKQYTEKLTIMANLAQGQDQGWLAVMFMGLLSM